MLVLHPTIQFLAVLVTFYVLCLGFQRFQGLHLQKKTAFRWKRHVVLGEVALVTFLLGMVGGVAMVYAHWRGFFITGTHGRLALCMAPLIIFGLASGLYMNARKRKRKVLPMLHGLNNLVVLILALTQVYSGWWVYKTFVLGE